MPAWRNRPFPRPVARDYRLMLLLAATCGLSTLAGFLFGRVGMPGELIAASFVLAYLSGGWFATQDVWHALKQDKIDIHFLMVAVALGALFIKGWTEGAILLFLFSLSNGLEQFANYRTRKSIESLLKVAPKHAVRRRGSLLRFAGYGSASHLQASSRQTAGFLCKQVVPGQHRREAPA